MTLVLLFADTREFPIGEKVPDRTIITFMEYIVASCSDKVVTEKYGKS
jgi:hypothetical protein